jgi:hypothetical protein
MLFFKELKEGELLDGLSNLEKRKEKKEGERKKDFGPNCL